MFRIPLSLFFIVFCITVHALPVRDSITEMRQVGPFKQIKVGHGIALVLTQSDRVSVRVSAADSNFLQSIKTEVQDGVLKIYHAAPSMKDITTRGKKLSVAVSIASLEKLTAHSGSSVKTVGIFKVPSMQVNVASGATFNGRLAIENLEINAATGATLYLEGNTARLKLLATTGAVVKAADFVSQKADVRSTTGARVELMVNDALDVYASTGGNILYKGSGSIHKVHNELGGVIRKLD